MKYHSILVRVSQELMDQLDRVQEELRRAAPALKISRSDTVRTLLLEALAQRGLTPTGSTKKPA